MSLNRFFLLSQTTVLVAAILLLASSVSAAGWKEKVLYSFRGGSDGATPAGGVAFDKQGNLYGATTDGGSSCPSPGCGMVFELSPPVKKGGAWTETILYGFSGSDGSQPAGSVIVNANGNLYGTTAYGGSGTCMLLGSNVGCGIVYELSPPAQQGGKWTYAAVYNFQGGKDGQYPNGDLAFDSAGNLYGATVYGGGFGTCNAPYFLYCGTIFKLSPPKNKGGEWKEKMLHAFRSGVDGANPNGGLLLDTAGNVYGTTMSGGSANCQNVGCGTVFKLTPPNKKGGAWSERVLHRFTGRPSDGSGPNGGLVLDAKGSLYGTTVGGGSQEEGVAYRLAPPIKRGGPWTEVLIHAFTGGKDGSGPMIGLTLDPAGNFYGAAGGGPSRGGLVFQMKPPARNGGMWNVTILYHFSGSPDGYDPVGVVFGKSGVMYGATKYGGTGQACQGGCGTLFEVTP